MIAAALINWPALAWIAGLLLTGFISGWFLRGPRIKVVRIVYAHWSLYEKANEDRRTIARLNRLHTHDVETICALQEQLEHFQAKEGLLMHRAGESPASTRNGAPRA